MLCVSMQILSRATAKKKTERVKGFKLCTFIWSFPNDIMFPSDIMAVKGLSAILDRALDSCNF